MLKLRLRVEEYVVWMQRSACGLDESALEIRGRAHEVARMTRLLQLLL